MSIVPALDLRPQPANESRPPLPHNIEAEQALLGALLYDNAAFERLDDAFRAEHFYEPFHQRLFAAIERAVRKGQLAEPILLAEQFSRDPAFEDMGGVRYLADVIDRAPPSVNAPDYARERELAFWPGVTARTEIRRKHYALVLTFSGASRFVTYPGSPSDGVRGQFQHIRDIRQELTALGAKCEAPAKSSAPRRQRNRTQPAALKLVSLADTRLAKDPFAALAGLKIRRETPFVLPLPEPPEPRLWAPLLKFFRKRGVGG